MTPSVLHVIAFATLVATAPQLSGQSRGRAAAIPATTLQAACPAWPGNTVSYDETTASRAIVTSGQRPATISRGDTARLAFTTHRGVVAASYTRQLDARHDGDTASAAPIHFAFAAGDCGHGIARLQSADAVGVDRSSELPYHLDGVLVVAPAAVPLINGSRWADTLSRSDSVPGGRRTEVIARRFHVRGDTVVDGAAAVLVGFQGDGTTVDDESAVDGSRVSVLIAITTRGTAILARDSRTMIARCDSTDLRISAAAGDLRMPEQRVSVARHLRLVPRP